MTHLDELHAILSERAHLRAQRDELQRDCTRLEAEARAAREELRKMRAATVADVVVPVIGRRVTVASAGAGVVANVIAFDDGSCVCTVDFGDAGMKAFAGKSVLFADASATDHAPAAIPPPNEQGDIAPPQEVDVIAWEFHFDDVPSWRLCNRDGFIMARMTRKDSGGFEGTYESNGTVEPGCNIVWSRDPYTVAVAIKGRLKETGQLEGLKIDESLFARKREVRWERNDRGAWVLKGQLDVPLGEVEKVGDLWRAWTWGRTIDRKTLLSAVEECEDALHRASKLDGLAVDRSLLDEPEQSAAIPSQSECEDIDEPETIADLLALGRPVIGLRVAVPWSVPPIPATVTSIDTYKDGDTCTILRDDGLSVSYWPKDLYFVKPAPEEKPAYVARWRKCETVDGWQLIASDPPMPVLATMTQQRTVFVSAVGAARYESTSIASAAELAEDKIRTNGRWMLDGPIDRSALNELRRNVDPGTHNAARMAARPYLSTALRRRGNAARDGTRRRRLRGQWWGHQPDRHRQRPRAMRR